MLIPQQAVPYNTIFEELTTGDGDDVIIGMVAYALYKEKKRDFVRAHEARKGASPTDEDLATFADTFVVHKGLEQLKIEGARILEDYANSFARSEAARSEIEKSMLGEMRTIADYAKPKHGAWKNFGLGIVSSLSASAILFILAMLFSASKPDSAFGKVFRAVFHNEGQIVIVPSEDPSASQPAPQLPPSSQPDKPAASPQ